MRVIIIDFPSKDSFFLSRVIPVVFTLLLCFLFLHLVPVTHIRYFPQMSSDTCLSTSESALEIKSSLELSCAIYID